MTVMLNTGTNVNVSDNKNKSTPLHLAVNQGNNAGVRSLLASRHCDVNCQGKIVFANKKLSAGEKINSPGNSLYGCAARSSGPYFRPKKCHFPHPF